MQDSLSQTFAALADPTRRAMLAQLSKGDANVSDLAKPFLNDMSLPAVTKHLKVLEKAGLITKSREAQYRPCKLNGDGLKEAADWMQEYRIYWEESFDRLDIYLKSVTSKRVQKVKRMPVMNKSNELKLTRVFDAPVQAVWDAWNDPEQAAQWWGPRGFTITTHSKDLKPGGHWNYTMHGPDGVDYKNITQYLEVENLKKMVYDHGGNDEQKPLFRVAVLFSEKNGKTTMDMTMTWPSAEAAEQGAKFIRKASGESTWDRLAEYLEKESKGKETFVINRSFDAPIELMFDVWTNPEHVSKWMGPAGSEMEYIRADINPGKSSFYTMAGGPMGKLYGRVDYIEIRKPDLMVYTQQFCDENEKLIRHPMAATWPATMLTVVNFTAEGSNRTRVTVTWECHGETTAEELATFIAARTGMNGGWTGSFNKLEDYLAEQQKS